MKNSRNVWTIAGIAASVLCLSGYTAFKLGEYTENDNMIIVTEAPNKSGSSIVETTLIFTSEIAQEPTTLTVTEPTTERLWININTADKHELMQLDGIGDVLADNIISYRDEIGEFRNIEELMLVEGIGETRFSAIRDYIYVENPVYPEVTESTTATEPPTEIISTTVTETTTEPQLTLEEIAPIDINTATIEELMLLPYVDEEIANKIIELRNAIGGYSHPYELLYVEELEQNQVAEIIDFVTVVQ